MPSLPPPPAAISGSSLSAGVSARVTVPAHQASVSVVSLFLLDWSPFLLQSHQAGSLETDLLQRGVLVSTHFCFEWKDSRFLSLKIQLCSFFCFLNFLFYPWFHLTVLLYKCHLSPFLSNLSKMSKIPAPPQNLSLMFKSSLNSGRVKPGDGVVTTTCGAASHV